MNASIKGFSKFNKEERIDWVISNYSEEPEKHLKLIKSYAHSDPTVQKLHDEFIENAIGNYYLPLGVVPNMLMDGKWYCIPLATEESSVVAAMSRAARFWAERGGFHTEVVSTIKSGHIHFMWKGDAIELSGAFETLIPQFYASTESLTMNMKSRGGGITAIRLIDKSTEEPGYFQIRVSFETVDSMGANFINSVLEQIAAVFKEEIRVSLGQAPDIIMSILSNYTPECLVRSEVKCMVDEFPEFEGLRGQAYAEKVVQAVNIACIEPYRAVTHNKGIMNGIDAVVIATGNDFRAVEACAHAYAARNGKYTSLSEAKIENGQFSMSLEIPLALGTVGGITALHPMSAFCLSILGKPNASELMRITASAGLAQNFAAVSSLVTSGIQKGHMKMHLLNILNQLGATEVEKETIRQQFLHKVPSHRAVVDAYHQLKGEKS